MSEGKEQPLVSVGIPTYNRPEGLRRTLKQITGQTYENLEIIVSDNCSPGNETRRVAESFNDERITYIRQKENIGAYNNFQFVLEKATADFFMWASDDDEWEPFFIEKTSEILFKEKNVVSCCMEAQYIIKETGKKFCFFDEGKAFYNFNSNEVTKRLKKLLKYYYGNLFYSLFRKEALFVNGKSCLSLSGKRSIVELPFFLVFAYKGNIKVINRIGFYKHAPLTVCINAKWQKRGGIFYPYLKSCFTQKDRVKSKSKEFENIYKDSDDIISVLFEGKSLYYWRKKIRRHWRKIFLMSLTGIKFNKRKW